MAKKANVGKQAPNKVGKQAHNNVGKQAPNNVGKQAPNNVGKQAPNNVGKQAPSNVGKQARKQKIRRTSSCMLCCSTFDTANSHNHMCSLGHQRQLAKIKSDYVPECQACGTKYVKMKNFVLHISTIEHKAKVKKLLKSNKKPICLEKCLDTETLKKIKNRNKLQRRLEKKAKNKKKKEELKKAMTSAGGGVSKTPKQLKQKQQNMVKQEKTPKQPKGAASKQPQQNLQNKENKLAGRLGWQNRGQQAAPQQQTEAPPSQSERHLYNAQIVQSASSQREGWGVPMTAPEQSTWSNSRQMGYSSSYNSSGTDHDFASVRLPQTRPTGEYKGTTRDSGAGLPSNPASISRLKGSTPPPTQDEGTGPIGSADVHKMLSNVRKALQTEKRAQAQSPSGGSEARRSWDQSSQVKVGGAGKHTELDTLAHGSIRSASLSTSGFPSIQSQQVSTSNAMPAKGARPNQKADITAQGRTPQTAKDGIETQFSMVSDLDGLESQDGPAAALRHGAPRALPASLSRHMSRTGPQAEPNLNTARRVRSLGGGGAREGEKEPEVKAIVQKLLGSGGSQRKVNWKEMYQEANRKKQEKVKGMPRFGIELVSPVSDPDGFTFYEDEEIPLTEGFHWESTQLVQLDPTQLVQLDHPAPPPPPAPHPQATPAPEIPQEAPLQGAEQPSVAPRAKRTAKPSAPVSVKAEPGWDGTGEGGLDRRAGDGQGDGQGEGRGKKKRKPDTEYPGVSGLNPSGKKQKGKSKNDKAQVDQLLAVSLKEEELCRSMQTVDGSLIQARNALQAAYAEVQRLLLVKQQVIDEINSLRARRIEILQGMQGGQNPLPHALSSPYTSSVLPPSVPSPPIPSLSPLTPVHPSSHFMANPSPLHPASSILQAIKQEALSSHSLPAATLPSQQRALSSAAAPVLTPPVSGSKPPEGQSMVKLEARSKMSDSSSSTASDSEEEQEGSAPGDRRGGPVDDDSDCVVVSIEDSDTEDVPEGHASSHHHPGPSHHHPGPSQQSSAPPPPPDSLEAAFVEVSSSATQTAVLLTHIKGVKIKEDPHIKGMKIKEDPHDRGARPDQEPEDVEPSLGSFLGHTGPVHGLQIHGGLLYTCSGDNTARAYSLVTRECQAVFVGHTNKINCLLVSPPRLPARLYTGSSDETVRCFSIKSQKCLELLSLPDRVLCLHSAWNILYVGLANGSVVSFDIKTLRQLDVFECHGPRGISCLGSCQEGARRLLLVGSYDSTISVRDARSSLLLRTLQGHSKTVLCSKVVNDLVFSGSSDTSVHAHNVHTGELVDIYKGHTHAVTAVAVLGKVMVTACLDKLVRVYELQSHDRLQVYGGHSDMVMCLAIHKSVIYTGCYDGTVQAVKLNLMENYRCWWHGCTLIFGVKDHLLQHLLSDHSHPHQPTLKCRWRDCSAFYTTKNLQKELPGHMQTHVEMDSKLDT